MSTDADVVREALTLAAKLPIGVPDAHRADLERLDELLIPEADSMAFAALDRLAAAEARAETFAEALRKIVDEDYLRGSHDDGWEVMCARQGGVARAALAAVTPTEAAEKRSAPENPSNVTRY